MAGIWDLSFWIFYFYSMILTLTYNGDQQVSFEPNKYASFDAFYVDYKLKDLKDSTGIKAQRLQFTIHPKADLQLESLRLSLSQNYLTQHQVYCNGFHSGVESRLYTLNEKYPTTLLKPFLLDQKNIPSGQLFSWAYTFVKYQTEINLIGSLSEHTGFTLFNHQVEENQLVIEKECQGLKVEHSYPAFDLLLVQGKESEVVDYFFNQLTEADSKIPKTKKQAWQIDINQSNLKINTEENKTAEPIIPSSLMVSSNYSKAFGDWLDFPKEGFKLLSKSEFSKSKKIISIAPFLCSAESNFYKSKAHCLLKNDDGQLFQVSVPSKKEACYVLDFYHQEVQEYLTKVVATISRKWNFDLIKLEGLYFAGIKNRPNKTRGQVLSEAIDFVSHLIGKDRLILQQVPLLLGKKYSSTLQITADAFGKSPSASRRSIFDFFKSQPKVNSIQDCQLLLDNWANWKSHFSILSKPLPLPFATQEEAYNAQMTSLLINGLLADELVLDQVKDLEGSELKEVSQELNYWQQAKINRIEKQSPEAYSIYFHLHESAYVALCNLSAQKQSLKLKKQNIELNPWESITLKM